MMHTHINRNGLMRTPLARLLALLALAMATAAPPLAAHVAPAAVTADARPTAAPGDTIQLPGVVVTATRVPVAIEALPVPVTVLTGAELRERGIRTVAEALRAVASAAVVQAGPRGGQTSVFLRGGQSGYVKILVDGVPANDPGGAIDLADLTTDQVERIEVVRGPASVLYGSDAVAGVVQIFTRRGLAGPTLDLAATGGLGERRHGDGRYGAVDASGTVSGATAGLGYMIGGGRSWNDGLYPMNSDRRMDVLNGRLDWAARPGSDVTVTARFSDSDTGLPTDGAGNLTDENARLQRRSVTVGVEGVQRVAERVVARLQLGALDRDQLALDEPDGPADTLGVYASRLQNQVRRLSADARLDVELPRSVASVGMAIQDQRGSSSYRSETQWGPYEAEADFQRSNRGYYAQLLTEPVANLHFTAGGRLDDNEVFGVFQTHRLGLTYGLGPVRARAAVGRAFREPTFAESFGSGFGDRGNPELVPERSDSWEVGADASLGWMVRLGATWFHQRFHDLIQFTFTPADPEDPSYFNVGAAAAEGLELTADAAVGGLDLSGSYTWLQTRVLDPGLATGAGFVEGEPLLRRPAHAAAFTGRYRLDAGALALTLNHVGDREDMDFGAGFPAPRVTLPAYTTLDLAAEHRLPLAAGGAWDMLVRVENALDARYEAIRGFPAPGRTISVGLRLHAGS
jgi:vitamin B12 transporter